MATHSSHEPHGSGPAERTADAAEGSRTVPPGRAAGRAAGRTGGRRGRGGSRGAHGGGGRAGGRGRRGNPRRKPRSRAARAIRITAAVVSLLLIGTAGAGYAYYEYLNSKIKSEDLSLGGSEMGKSKPNAAGQTPLNILLLGSDSRNSERNIELGGHRDLKDSEPRADVQMLLHLSADRKNASVISIPRDTKVSVPRCETSEGKVFPETVTTINSTLGRGGPGCTVATWYALTGIPVDHFMMVDFAGVVDMADAVGGVPVCVRDNVWDRGGSGLKLTKGEHKVYGEQALQWLRTRHAFEDGSDIGRTHAQHMYMNSLVRTLKSKDTLTNPGRMMDLAEAGTEALTVDEGIGTVKKLYDLGMQLKDVDLGRLTMLTMPWAEDPANKAHVVPTEDAEQLFAMVRNDVPLDDKGKPAKGTAAAKEQEAEAKADREAGERKAAPKAEAAAKAEIPVRVRNGSLVAGRAKGLGQFLTGQGFTGAVVAGNTDAPSDTSKTALLFPEGDEQAKANAVAVAEALRFPASGVRGSADVREVTLDIGADWPEGTDYRDSLPEPGSVPDSAKAQTADDESACMAVNVAGGYSF